MKDGIINKRSKSAKPVDSRKSRWFKMTAETYTNKIFITDFMRAQSLKQYMKATKDSDDEPPMDFNKRKMLAIRSELCYMEDLNYFRELPVVPGIDFLRNLVNLIYNAEATSDYKAIRMNIVDTMLFFEGDYYWIFTNTEGFLEVKTGFHLREIDHLLWNKVLSKTNNFSEESLYKMPAVVIKKALSSHPSNAQTKIVNWLELREYITGENVGLNDIFQLYVRSFGHNANFLRYFYDSTKGSIAYTLMNPMSYNDENIDENTYDHHIVSTMGDFLAYKKTGKCLAQFDDTALQLTNILQKSFGYRISSLTLDFIHSEEGEFYLVGMYSFTLSNKDYFDRMHFHKLTKEDTEKQRQEMKARASDLILCTLCQLNFPRQKVTKILNVRMILAVQGSLAKRGIDIYQHFRIKAEQFQSLSIRVCSLCYMVIVQEYKLIQLSKALATKSGNKSEENILVENDVQYELKYKQTGIFNDLDTLETKKIQWRIMVYFEYLTGRLENLLTHDKQYYIQFKFLRSTFGKEISSQSAEKITKYQESTEHSQEELHLGHLLIHHIFSLDLNICEFMKEVDMEIRITTSQEWEDVVARGHFHPLREFVEVGNLYFGDVQRNRKNIKLFTEEMGELSVECTFGLVREAENSVSMELKRYGRHHVYLPTLPFYTSDPLPEPWVEVFAEKERRSRNLGEGNEGLQVVEDSEISSYQAVLRLPEEELPPEPKRFRPSTAFANNPRLYATQQSKSPPITSPNGLFSSSTITPATTTVDTTTSAHGRGGIMGSLAEVISGPISPHLYRQPELNPSKKQEISYKLGKGQEKYIIPPTRNDLGVLSLKYRTSNLFTQEGREGPPLSGNREQRKKKSRSNCGTDSSSQPTPYFGVTSISNINSKREYSNLPGQSSTERTAMWGLINEHHLRPETAKFFPKTPITFEKLQLPSQKNEDIKRIIENNIRIKIGKGKHRQKIRSRRGSLELAQTERLHLIPRATTPYLQSEPKFKIRAPKGLKIITKNLIHKQLGHKLGANTPKGNIYADLGVREEHKRKDKEHRRTASTGEVEEYKYYKHEKRKQSVVDQRGKHEKQEKYKIHKMLKMHKIHKMHKMHKIDKEYKKEMVYESMERPQMRHEQRRAKKSLNELVRDLDQGNNGEFRKEDWAFGFKHIDRDKIIFDDSFDGAKGDTILPEIMITSLSSV